MAIKIRVIENNHHSMMNFKTLFIAKAINRFKSKQIILSKIQNKI